MLTNQLKTISFHLIYLLKKKKFIYKSRLFLNYCYPLSFINLTNLLKLNQFTFFAISFNFFIQNKDLYLLKREINLLALIWTKLMLLINHISFFCDVKKDSVIRSPFVYNKSHEQFESRNFYVTLTFMPVTNLMLYTYFLRLKLYVYKYGLFKFVKHLT